MTRQPIGHHGPTHLPWGEDPIPGIAPTPSPTLTRYAVFSGSYAAVAAGAYQDVDLATSASSVASNDASGVTPGSSWTGTYFAFDIADPTSLHLLLPGVYFCHYAIWIGVADLEPTGPVLAAIEETGSSFTVGDSLPGVTQGYFDGSFVLTGDLSPNDNIVLSRDRLYSLKGGTPPYKRGMSFGHNWSGSLDIDYQLVIQLLTDFIA